LFGSCVNPGILGNNPSISDTVGNDEGVAMQYDFRSVYASVLMDWFGLTADIVSDILFKEFQKLPIVDGCAPTSTSDYDRDFALNFMAFPNPTSAALRIRFESREEFIRLSIFDPIGSEIAVLQSGYMNAGEHQLEFETTDLPPGNYVIRIASASAQKTRSFIKI
ncbi:MAG TPA: T9SS type A sorting domain-containing protein, partial [Saprospiraceae bacterium]|nr:T9SS type A sorting domain-containing protein [Saprospiraceae bacterium]